MLVKLAGAALAAASAVLMGCAGPAIAQERLGPISVHGNTSTFEIAPVLLAAEDFYPGEATVKMGGIPNLVGEPAIGGFGEPGVADVATHAETQALRYSTRNPDLRIILNVTQGLYRIVARRSAGIEKVADLKGKKIATIPTTSSGYFLSVMLAREGLSYADIEAVPFTPLSDMTKALAEKRVDAVVIWEPYSENSLRVLGDDAIEFSGEGIYAEQFNLNSTAGNLADPIKRRKIVAFVRAVMDAAAATRADPAKAQALVVQRGGYTSEEVEHAWKHHAFNADYPGNMLDILVEEEKWLAVQEKREPRGRETLSALIDTSIYEEALALREADPAVQTAKVEDLRSIREIKNLQARLGHLALARDDDAMMALLTPDFTLSSTLPRNAGRDTLYDWLDMAKSAGIRPGEMNLHLFISPVITLSGDGQSATGRWHEVAMTARPNISADWEGTTHIVQYRNTPDGWRIAGIKAYEQFAGPYEGGWRHDAATLVRAPYHYTADGAGRLLTGRAAGVPRTADDLGREATLLLESSLAQNTVNAFGYYLDRGMYDDIVDLFAPDGTIDVSGNADFKGPEGVRKFLAGFGAPGLDQGELNDRPQLMPQISISDDGRTALVRVIEVGMTGQHGGEGQWSFTDQIFELARGADGPWRIARLARRPLVSAGYKEGWASPKQPAALTGQPRVDGPKPGAELVSKAASGAQVAIVPHALEKAEAFDGAENVSNAYGYYIDQFAWKSTADVFSRDGWKELSYIGTFVGKDRVLGSLVQRYGNGGPNDAFQAIHQKTQPYVTVLDDGKRAHIRSRLWQFNSSSTGPGSWISGIYENQVIKEDGIWRIHGMDLDYVWLGDYATGWTGIDPAASARFGPTEEQIKAFAPDAPLRGETFAPYPRIAPMGFHFANPVSGRLPETYLHWSDGYRAAAGE